MPLPSKFVYAELTPKSKQLLQSLLPYSYSVHHGNYITLDWDVDFELYSDLIGKTFYLTVDTLGFDNAIEAIRVDLSRSPIRSVNKNPHITWSANPEVNAYYSNYMLYVSDQYKTFGPVEIEVEVKADYF
jgi:hypothetical protein